MSNPIHDRQSSPELVLKAAGFRQAYENVKSAKRNVWVLIFTLSFIQLLIPLNLEFYEKYISQDNLEVISITLLIIVLISNTLYKHLKVDRLQELACSIQQCHEHEILELGQAPSFLDARPSEVHSLGEKWLNKNSKDRRNLELWWPKLASTIPYTPAKIICLLSSFSWEFQLRKKYQNFLHSILIALITISLLIMYSKDFKISQYITLIFVPLIPITGLVLEEILNNYKCLKLAEHTTTESINLWNLLLENKIPMQNCEDKLDRLLSFWQQYYRVTATPIFGWLYWLSLKTMDKAMTVDANNLIHKYKNKL